MAEPTTDGADGPGPDSSPRRRPRRVGRWVPASSGATSGGRCSATRPSRRRRGRALQSFSNFFLHLYPVKVPARVLRIRYSFRLGFIATVLFVILVVTGVYLMFFYTPAVGSAYGDMQHLRTSVGFGQLVRNVHRWSAHLMVLVVVLHLARAFFAGAYKRPREFNWVIGVTLLVLTLALSFTGYLLPWDQLSYWAVTVGTNLVQYVPLLGGRLQDLLHRWRPDRPGHPAALLRPARRRPARRRRDSCCCVHIWRVRKDGFAVERPSIGTFEEQATRRAGTGRCPMNGPSDLYGGRTRVLGVVDRESITAEERTVDDTVFTWPHLLVRHVVVALGVAAVVLALGVAFAAPLRGLANPNLTPEPAKAPWYFAGLQELLSHFDPLVAGILVPRRRGADARAAALHRPEPLDRRPSAQGRDRALLRAAHARRSS